MMADERDTSEAVSGTSAYRHSHSGLCLFKELLYCHLQARWRE